MPNTVRVPKEFEPIFQKAQEYVGKYFKEKREDPSKGTIEIFGQRYILVRAASMSVDFFETVKNLYRDTGDEEALNVARSLLFDIAHAIGKADAKNFHKRMDLKDPIEKLSAGPVHFSHSGWAFVDIFPESKPSPDENYFLIYDHPFSFESDAWLKAGKKSDFPVCVMNAGYSSGWCEESFGVPLVASEIMCRAKGDDVCRFIMAHSSKIEDYIKEYLRKEPELARKVTKYEIPGFFRRKHIEEELRRAHDELEKRVQERTAELAKVNKALQAEINERKQAEEELRRTHFAIDSAPEGIAWLDRNFHYIYANEGMCKMSGYMRDELLSLKPSDLDLMFPQKPPSELWIEMRHIKSQVREGLFRRKDGTTFPVELTIDHVVFKDEEYIFVIMRDITERKRAEEKLRESEERYRDLFDNASDLIQSVDEKGKFVYVNKKWKEVMGYSDEEIKKLNLTDVLRKDQIPHCMELFKKVVHGETLDNVEVVLVTKEGREILASGFVNPRIKDGKFVATRAIFRDVTERRRVEENLKKAKEEAEEANRLKSEFLANMSHEIRTPMNAIIGMTGITLDTELTAEQRECLNIVKDSGYALLGLIDDILDLSKIESVRISLEIIDFDLRTTMEGVADTLAARASTKGLELACMIHHEVPTLLRGDPGRLRQILMNLGGNAVKFTEKGEVVIRAELDEETEDQARLLFSVTDTGIGITKDKQEKIFEAFTQADGSTTRKYGGVGLGLSISKRLVELLGGQIGVESQPGKGTRFWFTVTLERQKEAKKSFPMLPIDIRGMRMLVVDDNQTNRTILVKMLESFGCCAEAVESGTKALQILKRAVHKEKLFDLVFLDMQMPEMNGEETLRAIKDDPEIKDVVVIIVTSFGAHGETSRLEALGCAGYLLKPVKQSQLFDTIITVLSREKSKVKEIPIPIVIRHTVEDQKRRAVRILLAEDNPMNQKFAVTLLKKAGYSVDAVGNGRMAIEALKRTAYDLVLMDVQMPEMNGFEATQIIRKREGEGKHTPIIAITAHAMKGDRERCLQAGMDDYVSKPIEPQELFDTIERWTKSRGSKKALSPSNFSPSALKGDKDTPICGEPACSEPFNFVQDKRSRTAEPTCGEYAESIDLETALRRFGGDKEFFKEMLEEFFNYAPKQLEKLVEAIETGDAKMVEREAHSIKGAAGNLGAKTFADLALQLEILGRTKDLAKAKELIGNLQTELNRVKDYFNQSFKEKIALKS
jgi:two-component system sensor histidine kinase/response regulator